MVLLKWSWTFIYIILFHFVRNTYCKTFFSDYFQSFVTNLMQHKCSEVVWLPTWIFSILFGTYFFIQKSKLGPRIYLLKILLKLRFINEWLFLQYLLFAPGICSISLKNNWIILLPGSVYLYVKNLRAREILLYRKRRCKFQHRYMF